MSGESAKKARHEEIFDFKNVTPVKYVSEERREKLEMEWEIRNFFRALAMNSDAASPGIRMIFESGKSVSLIEMNDFRQFPHDNSYPLHSRSWDVPESGAFGCI
jgi:hypothetical protein